MGNSDSSLDTLLCIVGERFFYFGILNESNHITQSEQIKINTDFSFFNTPETICRFLDNSIDSFDFKEVKIGIVHEWFSLVPNKLEGKEAEHWIIKPDDLEVDFHMDSLSQLNVAYYIPSELKRKLLALDDNVSFRHLMTVNLYGNEDTEGVHSYKLNGLQFLQVVDNQKTIFSNLVKSNSLNSQLYFSLLPFHLHKKDPHQVQFHTSATETELTEELETYIKNMQKVEASFSQTPPSNLTNEYLFQLEKLDSCVS